MEKRKIILGDYDTATNGWTLTGWALAGAEQKTNYINKPNGDGTWDLTTVLTDGLVKYNDRKLTVTLECSDGTRQGRETKIRQLINRYDGIKQEIRLPDDDLHHLVGRPYIVREYNDPAHARVKITATCEPWKYANAETIVTVTASATTQYVTLHNEGRRAVVPQIQVSGGTVHLGCGNEALTLSDGSWRWPNLLLTPGDHALAYRGSGTITVTYREAVLE